MKKIQSICIVALLAAFALTSCNYTDLDPTDMVGPDKAFGNVQNVHKAVVGIYGKASLRSKLAVTEYIADDCVQGGDSGGAGTDLAGWVYTATSGDVSGLWAHYYGIINQANRVLNYGPKVKPLNAEEETSLQVSLGTAYFFRAYAHFELLCFFSDFSNDDALGIPYVSHYHVVGNPPRDKVGACYEQIMTDLTRAYDMLTVAAPDLAADNKATNSTAYISQAAVDALRARVSLYHKKYTHAYIYASNALRAVGIAKLGEVQNLWLDKSNAGTIFKLSRPAGSSTIGTLFVGRDYSSVFRPSNELRAERIEGYTAQTYPGLLAEIIKERRCELVWEGHRLFDARRLKVTMTREGKTISADDYRLTLPIPQAETDANSGISESDQNYGY